MFSQTGLVKLPGLTADRMTHRDAAPNYSYVYFGLYSTLLRPNRVKLCMHESSVISYLFRTVPTPEGQGKSQFGKVFLILLQPNHSWQDDTGMIVRNLLNMAS